MDFKEYVKKSSEKSSVWQHFLRSTNGLEAKCKLCHSIFKIGGSTGPLHYHLLKKHSINLKQSESLNANKRREDSSTASTSRSDGPPSKKQKMTDYFESEDSLPNVITRMVVLDGIPLKVFCTSNDLRKLIKINSKETLPKSPNSIKKMIMDKYETEKKALMEEIQVMRNKNVMFSITLDEWTSLKSHRYMNINIHFQNDGENVAKSLGLVRISGSMDAEACGSLIQKRLDSFGLRLYKDIVGMTTDGAPVMIKVGKILPVLYHQLCFAHAVQLAVVDVLYKKTDEPEKVETCEDSDSDNEEDGLVIEHTRGRGMLNDDFKSIIKKVRSVVKLFKNSPTKNDTTLQKYVQNEFGKELQLLLDCKTRWNSLATMIERFLKLKKCVQKALIDVKSALAFTEEEFNCLQNLHISLDMTKTTVETLCRRDATILTAETAIKFLVLSLEKRDRIGQKLANSLKARIKQRRLYKIVGALKYLHNPNKFLNENEDEETFKKCTYEELKNVLCEVAAMTEHNTFTTRMNSSTETLCESDSEPSPLSYKEQLNRQLSFASEQPSTSTTQTDLDLPAQIHIEMALFENGGRRGEILKDVYSRLLAIPPTSVESERAFSTAGFFCNKLRSRLNDETLDAFMFLRSRFLSRKQN